MNRAAVAGQKRVIAQAVILNVRLEQLAVIVVSSAWRQIPTCYQHLQEWLAKYDMTIYDKTPYVGGDRGDDISAWFNRHPGNWQYAILDDDDDMGVHIDHLIRTDFDLGLTEKEADRCIELLQKEV